MKLGVPPEGFGVLGKDAAPLGPEFCAVQFSPFWEVRMVPTPPTATKEPNPNRP